MMLNSGIILCVIAAQVLGAPKPCYRDCESTHRPEIPSGFEIKKQGYERILKIHSIHPVASVLPITSAPHNSTKGTSGEYQGSIDTTTGDQNTVGTFESTDGVHAGNERYKRENRDESVQQTDDLGEKMPNAKPAECVAEVFFVAQWGVRILRAVLQALNN